MINSALAQSQFFPTRTGILSGGRAPRFWKRELRREMDLLATTLDSCGWLKPFAEIRPSLLGQPLLGNCLAEITSSGRQQPDEAQAQASPASRSLTKPTASSRRADRKAFGQPPSSSARRINQAELNAGTGSDWMSLKSPAASRPRRTTRPDPFVPAGESETPELHETPSRQHKVFELPVQAESSLLKRFAAPEVKSASERGNSSPDILSLPTLPHSRSGASSPAMSSMRRTDVLESDPETRHRHVQGQQLPSATRHHWRNLVADRAARGWLREWPSATATVASSPTLSEMPAAGLAPPPAASETCTSKILEEQWLTPLDGPRVSPEILRRLVKSAGSVGEGNGARAERSASDSPGARNFPTVRSEANSETATSASGPRSDDHPQDFVSRQFEGVFPERQRRPFMPESARDLFDQPAQSSAIDSQAWRSSSNVSPPSVTSSMPPLLPAASPGSPVLPIAAAASRYGAWRGEVDAPEKDLNLLAAQMKRILDEEARRHGIDV